MENNFVQILVEMYTKEKSQYLNILNYKIKCQRCGKNALKLDAINSYGEWYC